MTKGCDRSSGATVKGVHLAEHRLVVRRLPGRLAHLQPRAGWIGMLLWRWLRNAAQPPGSSTRSTVGKGRLSCPRTVPFVTLTRGVYQPVKTPRPDGVHSPGSLHPRKALSHEQ